MQGQRAERCVEHKTEGMVNVASRRCRDPTCTRLAHYNFSEQKSKLTCMEHKVRGEEVLRCEELWMTQYMEST